MGFFLKKNSREMTFPFTSTNFAFACTDTSHFITDRVVKGPGHENYTGPAVAHAPHGTLVPAHGQQTLGRLDLPHADAHVPAPRRNLERKRQKKKRFKIITLLLTRGST